MSRCVPVCMAEGLSQRAALGKCEGVFDEYVGANKPKHKAKRKGKS